MVQDSRSASYPGAAIASSYDFGSIDFFFCLLCTGTDAMVHLSVIRILRLRSASEISIAGLVGFRFLLDSGLHVADAVASAEAPLAAASARDVDDAAPLVTAAREGRLAATWG